MFRKSSSHLAAVLQALLVTMLWSISWVLIKIGLEDIPALTFAGLRYTLAFLCLLPFALHSGHLKPLCGLPRRKWLPLIALGLVYYTLTQGTQFLTLNYLPAVTFSLLLNFTSVIVALLGIIFLSERLAPLHWGGIVLSLLGAAMYFYPVALPTGQVIGLVIALICVSGNSISSVLGRSVNRDLDVHPLAVTTISMGIGGTVLLASGLLSQGLPPLSLPNWGIIICLAVVNTAFAFTLWNHTLRTLTAVESSIINNTMLIQIAVLAWLFLEETLTGQEILGMALVAVGTLAVQLRRHQPA